MKCFDHTKCNYINMITDVDHLKKFCNLIARENKTEPDHPENSTKQVWLGFLIFI